MQVRTEKYLLALQNTTQQPLLQNLKKQSYKRKNCLKLPGQEQKKGDENDTRATLEKNSCSKT